MLVVFTVKF